MVTTLPLSITYCPDHFLDPPSTALPLGDFWACLRSTIISILGKGVFYRAQGVFDELRNNFSSSQSPLHFLKYWEPAEWKRGKFLPCPMSLINYILVICLSGITDDLHSCMSR